MLKFVLKLPILLHGNIEEEADGLNHYWELTNEPNQLPALPTQIEIAI